MLKTKQLCFEGKKDNDHRKKNNHRKSRVKQTKKQTNNQTKWKNKRTLIGGNSIYGGSPSIISIRIIPIPHTSATYEYPVPAITS